MIAASVEDLVDQRMANEHRHDPLGELLREPQRGVGYLRQPLSMVSEWPRLGIFVISVTAWLRRCRL